MKYDYKKMKENLEVIRNVCRKYRNEITVLSASYALNLGLFDDCNDYISFVNELSFDEFVKTSNEEISKKYLDLIS